jgi:predicted nucleotidyltransferase
MDQNDALKIAKSYLNILKNQNYNFLKVYLFGSYAKGNFTNNSDIDLAIIFNHIDDKFNTQVKLLMLTSKIDTRLEPHPIDIEDFNSSNPFYSEIIKYGIEVN